MGLPRNYGGRCRLFYILFCSFTLPQSIEVHTTPTAMYCLCFTHFFAEWRAGLHHPEAQREANRGQERRPRGEAPPVRQTRPGDPVL